MHILVMYTCLQMGAYDIHTAQFRVYTWHIFHIQPKQALQIQEMQTLA